jgi:DNA-binding transcriptional LysR family regulator
LLPEYNDYDNRLEAALRALGIEPRVRLRTDSLALAMERLRSSDWLMAGTRSMSGKTAGLQMLPYSPEFALPDTSVVLCYPRRIRNSPRTNWLAGQIRSIVESAQVSRRELPGAAALT